MRRRAARHLGATLLILAAIGAASPARAAETPITRRSALGVDLRWWSAQRTGSVFPIVPFFHYEIIPDLFVDLDVAMAPQVDEDAGRFGIGNPTGGLHYALTTSGGALTWFAGLRAGAPLATAGDLDSDLADDYASAASGHYDVYRWVPEMVPLLLTVGLEAHPTRSLWLRVPLTPMLFVPTTSRREAKTGFEARIEIEGVSRMGLGGGYALQVIGSNAFRTREEDRAQFATEPYLVFDNDVFLSRLGVLIAVDSPLGFGVVEGGVLAPHLEIGGHLK
jgi:hypothetical protein